MKIKEKFIVYSNIEQCFVVTKSTEKEFIRLATSEWKYDMSSDGDFERRELEDVCVQVVPKTGLIIS